MRHKIRTKYRPWRWNSIRNCSDYKKSVYPLVYPPYPGTPQTVKIVFGANDGTALAGISRADAAVAQTGALVFFNRGDNPAANHFLPEQHLIVVKASEIKDTMSDVLTSSCKTNAVNLIAGPSSTADIPGRMLVGVHGPARVICYIIKN